MPRSVARCVLISLAVASVCSCSGGDGGSPDESATERIIDSYEAVVGHPVAPDAVTDQVGVEGSIVCDVDYSENGRFIVDTEEESALILRVAAMLEFCPALVPALLDELQVVKPVLADQLRDLG